MRTSMAILLVLALAGGTTGLAQPDPDAHHRPDPGHGHGKFMEKLGLSEKQKTDIGALRTEMEKTMVGIDAKIKLARIDLKALVAADSPDQGAIEGKLKEINDLQFQAKKAHVDHLFAVFALLTPEQKKTFKDQMMRGLAGGGMHPMMRRFQGHRPGMMQENAPD